MQASVGPADLEPLATRRPDELRSLLGGIRALMISRRVLPEPSYKGAPGERVRRLAEEVGATTVVEDCAAILAGSPSSKAADARYLAWLGGRHGEHHFRHHLDRPEQAHWPRVWAARALLYVWADAAGPAVVVGLTDDAWRVREMAAKVVRRHQLGDAGEALVQCLDDPVARVRAAAARALGHVGDTDAASPLMEMAVDDDLGVRAAARAGLRELRKRLDLG